MANDMAGSRSLQIDQCVQQVVDRRNELGRGLIGTLIAQHIDRFLVDAHAADGRVLALQRGLQRGWRRWRSPWPPTRLARPAFTRLLYRSEIEAPFCDASGCQKSRPIARRCSCPGPTPPWLAANLLGSLTTLWLTPRSGRGAGEERIDPIAASNPLVSWPKAICWSGPVLAIVNWPWLLIEADTPLTWLSWLARPAASCPGPARSGRRGSCWFASARYWGRRPGFGTSR